MRGLVCNYGLYNTLTYLYGATPAQIRSDFFFSESSYAIAKVPGIGQGAYVQVLPASVTINNTKTVYEVRQIDVLDGPVSYSVEGIHTTFAKEEARAQDAPAVLSRFPLPGFVCSSSGRFSPPSRRPR